MSGWRYFAQRLTGNPETDEIFDLDLPLQDVHIVDVLSGPTRITAKIDPVVSQLLAPDGRPLLGKWNTAIYAEHESGEVFGTILDDPKLAGSQIALNCIGFAGYPSGQPYTESWSGVEVDPLDVVRQAWLHLQTQFNGDLGVEVDATTQTPIRLGIKKTVRELDPQDDPNVGPSYFESGPARLAWYETDDIGEYIDRLASDTPFDYHERHEWDGETIRHHLDFYYPRKGNRRNDLRYVVGENIAVIPNVDTDEYATEVLALGAGEGRSMLRSTQSRPWSGLRRAVTVIDKSARTKAAVNSFARRELAWRVGLDDIADIIVRDHPNAPFSPPVFPEPVTVSIPVGLESPLWRIDTMEVTAGYEPGNGPQWWWYTITWTGEWYTTGPDFMRLRPVWQSPSGSIVSGVANSTRAMTPGQFTLTTHWVETAAVGANADQFLAGLKGCQVFSDTWWSTSGANVTALPPTGIVGLTDPPVNLGYFGTKVAATDDDKDEPAGPLVGHEPPPAVPVVAEVIPARVGDEIFVQGYAGWEGVGHWCRILEREITPESGDLMKFTIVRSDKLGDPHPLLTPIAVAEATKIDDLPIPLSATGWKYLPVALTDTVNRSAESLDDGSWAVGTAGFGGQGTGAVVGNTYWAVQSAIWLRRQIRPLTPGVALVISGQVDNIVDVYWNGSLLLHQDTSGQPPQPFTVTVPAGSVGASNTLAVRAQDDATNYGPGEGCFIDVAVRYA